MKLLALALCLCLVAFGWPVATLASASADVSAAPGSVAASTPAPSPSEAPPSGDETSPAPSGPPPAANGGLVPPAPRAGTVTVSTWWDLKAEVEDPDGAPVILVGSALTAKDKFDSATSTFIAAGTIAVTRRVTIQSAAGGPFTITRSDRPFEEFFTAFFKVTAGGELTLQNVTLDGNRGQIPVPANESLVVVDNGILTLGDGAVLKNNSSKDNGGGVNVRQGALTMGGTAQIGGSGTGEGNTAKMGGGVFVTGAGSKLTMTGGGISGNTANAGGGVGAESGTLNLSGTARIDGNTAKGNGGGVYVEGAFTMQGGSITGNKATDNYSLGGGVFVDRGIFTMTDGRITGNAAGGGDGMAVYLSNPANDVEISGGLLSAQGGSVIDIGFGETLIVSGGAVMQTDPNGAVVYHSGDYADQVKVTNNGTVYSRGKVVEYENTALTFPGPSGDGLVILQTGSHAPYAIGAGTDLTTDPAGAAAKWAVEGGTGGVRYENGANVGFLPLGVAVGQEAPPQPDNYSVRTLRDAATGVEVTAYCAPSAVLTVIKDHLHDKGACAACDAIRQSGAPAAVYDISIEGGYSGYLDLALPLGQGRDGQEVLVRHCRGSQVEDMTLTAAGGSVRGTFSSLSPFAVFGKASSSSSSSSSGSSSSSNSSSSQSASSSQGGGSNSSGGSVPGSSRPQANGSSAGPMFWIWYVLGAVAVLVIAGALLLHKRYRGSGPKG